ncbi:hypothetical protein OG215_36740 (plasmid) [Streptomyces globisporus]|uniref:hypothetical protein n=1 Tax=Streptomyces globisporus TaxID=1908 RepID=UPI002F90B024|nr:hypothetical protein OG215_36740 [Streptomyces globisporus]
MSTEQNANGAVQTEAIRARMAQIRTECAAARACGDTRSVSALDGELAELGQRLRNLRETPDYDDGRCCPDCP